MSARGLLIHGCGGQARSVADIALLGGIGEIIFIDGNARDGERIFGCPVRPDLPDDLPEGWSVISAIGDNRGRESSMRALQARGWPIATIISPRATLGPEVTIGVGTVIGHHVHLGPCAAIGVGCILNTGAIVEHDAVVEDFAHVSIAAAIAGYARIGRFTFVGAGAVIIDRIRVAEDVIIGAGGVVVRDLDAAGVYVGVPVRVRKSDVLRSDDF